VSAAWPGPFPNSRPCIHSLISRAPARPPARANENENNVPVGVCWCLHATNARTQHGPHLQLSGLKEIGPDPCKLCIGGSGGITDLSIPTYPGDRFRFRSVFVSCMRASRRGEGA